MGINFHAEENRQSYKSRDADVSWKSAVLTRVNPSGKRVVDIGCGGGIYSKAWMGIGAASVKGVDFSEVMLDAARENCQGIQGIHFQKGDALATGLPGQCADIVFARALIHHLHDLEAFFAEVSRLLVSGGICLVQDRTLEDVRLPGTSSHIRGFFFESFPRLMEKEQGRRPDAATVKKAMNDNGLITGDAWPVWEVRRVYEQWADLETDLLARTGRSLLHELSEEELGQMVAYIKGKMAGEEQIVEQDRWTFWISEKV